MRKICPDVITCSAVMSAFDKGKQWKAAKALLIAMEKSFLNSTKVDDTEWVLPSPNEFTYASAISSCARCSQFEEALEILDRMRNNAQNSTIEDSPSPNRWVYNSALAACVPPSQNWLGNYTERFHTAVEIIRRMEEDALLLKDHGITAVLNLQTAQDIADRGNSLSRLTQLYLSKGIKTAIHFPVDE